MTVRKGRKAGAPQESRKVAAVQSQPLSSHGWEGKQTLMWLALLLDLPLPSILELQSSQGTGPHFPLAGLILCFQPPAHSVKAGPVLCCTTKVWVTLSTGPLT